MEEGDWISGNARRHFDEAFVELVANAPALADLRELHLDSPGLSPRATLLLQRLTKLERLVVADPSDATATRETT